MPAFSYLHEHRLRLQRHEAGQHHGRGRRREGDRRRCRDARRRPAGRHLRYPGLPGPRGGHADGPSVASDLYTIGRTLAVLMLRFLFHEGQYLYALPSREEEPLFAQWESLHRFLLRACAYHPDDRFQSAGEMNEQLLGVLREMAAISDGRPRAYSSTLFERDQLTSLLTGSAEAYDVTRPDWRVLPRPQHRPRRPRRRLPDRAARARPGPGAGAARRRRAGRPGGGHRPRPSCSVARQQVALGPRSQRRRWPGWRRPTRGSGGSRWYRAIHQLQSGYATEAAEGFSRVWTELPGESAPKLAVALAAEMAGDYDRAAEVYDLVASADSTYVSAAFGLARCRAKTGTSQAVVEAYNRVPPSLGRPLRRPGGLGPGPGGRRPGRAAHRGRPRTPPRPPSNGSSSTPRSGPAVGRCLRAGPGRPARRLDPGRLGHLLGQRADRAVAAGGPGAGLPRPRPGWPSPPAERIALIDRANAVRPRSLL